MDNNSCKSKEDQPMVIFACSGASDVGELTDLVARKLHCQNAIQMKCLAFVGAGIQSMIDTVKESQCLVLDGCGLDCGRITMIKNGINNFTHLRLSNLGYEKGKSVPNEHHVDAIYDLVNTFI